MCGFLDVGECIRDVGGIDLDEYILYPFIVPARIDREDLWHDLTVQRYMMVILDDTDDLAFEPPKFETLADRGFHPHVFCGLFVDDEVAAIALNLV